MYKRQVVEALECPTLLKNGYGEHNIQGIGDKHVPLIHNVMNTDFVVDISDKATDNLNLVFNTKIGKDYLTKILGLENSLELRHHFAFGIDSHLIYNHHPLLQGEISYQKSDEPQDRL